MVSIGVPVQNCDVLLFVFISHPHFDYRIIQREEIDCVSSSDFFRGFNGVANGVVVVTWLVPDPAVLGAVTQHAQISVGKDTDEIFPGRVFEVVGEEVAGGGVDDDGSALQGDVFQHQ